MGVPSCVFFGWLVDRYSRRRNGEIMLGSMGCMLLVARAPTLSLWPASSQFLSTRAPARAKSGAAHRWVLTSPRVQSVCGLTTHFLPSQKAAAVYLDLSGLLPLGHLLGLGNDVVMASLLLLAGFALIGTRGFLKAGCPPSPSPDQGLSCGHLLCGGVGPYSLLAGVFAADLGGSSASATACSLIDFAGAAAPPPSSDSSQLQSVS